MVTSYQELLMHLALIQGQQVFIDAQAALLMLRRRRRRNKRQPRLFWVRPWLSVERRLQFGHYDRLMTELRVEDHHSFLNFMS
ncbi:hypothetical protein CI610_03752 [invertebrate metagenome]|uniref:Uncharacterized protein n=1 Tax=invertebrate metagenome TaxID=1711999 RepID=A0A2H9T284_9ZZZZ